MDREDVRDTARTVGGILLYLVFFFGFLSWFFRLRHFHLLSQVVTRTQIFRYPRKDRQVVAPSRDKRLAAGQKGTFSKTLLFEK